MNIYTIGFTKTSAEHFFNRIKNSKANKIIDVRLNNISQLSGFAKRDDLRFFAKAITNVDYRHLTALAPSQGMLDKYKKERGPWSEYAKSFLDLMALRKIENLPKEEIDGACFLCSEDKPHNCHRRLVAEYLERAWGDVKIIHL